LYISSPAFLALLTTAFSIHSSGFGVIDNNDFQHTLHNSNDTLALPSSFTFTLVKQDNITLTQEINDELTTTSFQVSIKLIARRGVIRTSVDCIVRRGVNYTRGGCVIVSRAISYELPINFIPVVIKFSLYNASRGVSITTGHNMERQVSSAPRTSENPKKVIIIDVV
jgi:hypothetical protein